MPRTTSKKTVIKPWMVWTVVTVLFLGAAGLSTTVRSTTEVEEAASAGSFDPAGYATERFDAEIVPQIQDEAIELPTLLNDLAAGADEADFGKTPGTGSSYSFPVTFEAVAGPVNGSILPVTVAGVSPDVQVQVQVGPAINGTALRDVTGTVSFNDFTNQLEFQQVATEFNIKVRDGILADVDTASLAGKTITVTGAFTRVNPNLVSIVPVAFEVQP